jgi:3-oxoacyl-[acyl-carrier protein] reductase
MVRAALDQCGGLDTLICNAAVQGPVGRLWETDWKAWAESLNVNLLAQVALCRAAIPALLRARRGTIILISGGGATGPRPNFSAYATAKAGLVRFAETLAHELAGTAVTVNCIAPGAMPTRMLQDVADAGAARAGAKEYEAAQRALGGGDAVMERAAALAVFLATGKARGITGRVISAPWDNWEAWPDHAEALRGSDLYTLRRIAGRDRGQGWGDK